MDKPKRGRGRPPKAGKAMMVPITIRLSKAMDDEIEAMVQARAYEGGDKSTVMREALAIGLREMAKRKGGQ
jgi:Arc/MetJ-type ribon-helix-helix transcriptional regulator